MSNEIASRRYTQTSKTKPVNKLIPRVGVVNVDLEDAELDRALPGGEPRAAVSASNLLSFGARALCFSI